LAPSLFKAGINWHCDFYSGHTWPLKPFNRIYDPNDSGVDLNVPFALSRLQFVPCLIQAYESTRDDRFVRRLFAIVDSWIENNPFGFGVNWWSGLEVALRAVNLALAIAWFFDRLKDRERSVYLTMLWRHAVYLYRFDIVNDKVANKNNHFLGSMAGLLVASLCFQGRQAEHMRQAAIDAIGKEIPRQFLEDGVNFESATGYHQFSLEAVLTVILFLRSRDERLFETDVAAGAFGATATGRIQKALDFVWYYMASFGRSPHIGDSSDCRVLVFKDYFHGSPDDHAFLFDMGAAACSYRRPLPVETIRRFYPQSGHAFFKNDVYGLAAFAGPKGSNGTGGHGHNDKGSFVLSVKGRPVLVDSGTYIYNSEIHNRYDLKRSRAHNVVVVGNQEQCDITPQRVFGLPGSIRPRMETAASDGLFQIRMGHDGFNRLGDVAWVEREIRCYEKKIELTDRLSGSGRYPITVVFNLHPAIIPDVDSDRIRLVDSQGFGLLLAPPENVRLGLEESWYSESYHHRARSSRIVVESEVALPAVFQFHITIINDRS
jgi:hypothetical protein